MSRLPSQEEKRAGDIHRAPPVLPAPHIPCLPNQNHSTGSGNVVTDSQARQRLPVISCVTLGECLSSWNFLGWCKCFVSHCPVRSPPCITAEPLERD